MNIEHLTRSNYIIKLSMLSTGNLEISHNNTLQKIHSVAGDQFNLKVDIVWGNNHIVIRAIDDSEIEFLRLDSEVPISDWEGKNLADLAENVSIKAGEEKHFFFVYPISLSDAYLKLNKDDLLYYE